MKTVPFLKGEYIDPSGTCFPITTLQLIENVLDNRPENGFTYEDFRKRSRIDSQILSAGDGTELLLEDRDWETLRDCVRQMRWGVRSAFIQEFIKQFYD